MGRDKQELGRDRDFLLTECQTSENSGISRLLSIVMLNSVLAMSGAGLGTLFLSRLIVKQWSVYRIIGGMLAGK